MAKFSRKQVILWLVLLVPYLCLIPGMWWYNKVLDNVSNSSFIIISKQDMMLYHYNYKGELLQKSGIACGKNIGNKQNIGDYKTPEGVFRIGQIKDASTWSHDFKGDSLGEIAGAYGPFFISLDVPGHKGIGIHGTHDPNSIGTRASEGCIRLPNEELIKLVKRINTATVVVITPSQSDVDSTIKSIKQVEKKDKIIPKQKTKH